MASSSVSGISIENQLLELSLKIYVVYQYSRHKKYSSALILTFLLLEVANFNIMLISPKVYDMVWWIETQVAEIKIANSLQKPKSVRLFASWHLLADINVFKVFVILCVSGLIWW